MLVRDILAKTILSKSRVSEYTINAYVGCSHACVYCYAKFMKRFTGHQEPWGEFVDVKINAPELLAREVRKKKPGKVWISGVCDCYQPLEQKYKLTRSCLEILIAERWPVTIQTKSPLVLRDIDLLKSSKDVEVGFTITTADERIRKLFEPGAPPIQRRIEALARLHAEGIRTFVMIAPILPGADNLPDLLKGTVDHVLIDRLNYHYADWLYKKHRLQAGMTDSFFEQKGSDLGKAFRSNGMTCQVLF